MGDHLILTMSSSDQQIHMGEENIIQCMKIVLTSEERLSPIIRTQPGLHLTNQFTGQGEWCAADRITAAVPNVRDEKARYELLRQFERSFAGHCDCNPYS
jgi:hypothetical protein